VGCRVWVGVEWGGGEGGECRVTRGGGCELGAMGGGEGEWVRDFLCLLFFSWFRTNCMQWNLKRQYPFSAMKT